MNGLVLASHGSREEPMVNETIWQWASQIRAQGHFQEVVAAFHQGKPHFGSVLDGMTSRRIVVVPVMTSTGYYTNTVLPRALAQNRRFEQVSVTITPPLGTHPGMLALLSRRIERLLSDQGLTNERVSIAIVGHGTKRHRCSRDATLTLVRRLSEHLPGTEVLPAFLDDDPPVESIMERAARDTSLVIPFLIAAGPHAQVDLPRRMGMNVQSDAEPPFVERIGPRLVICDQAVGTDPEILSLILGRAVVCLRD